MDLVKVEVEVHQFAEIRLISKVKFGDSLLP